MHNPTVMNERDAAAHVGVSPRALQAWRVQGRGPRFVRISARCVRYRREDLDAFIAARVVASTSERTPAELQGDE